jgi:hypothetical protein
LEVLCIEKSRRGGRVRFFCGSRRPPSVLAERVLAERARAPPGSLARPSRGFRSACIAREREMMKIPMRARPIARSSLGPDWRGVAREGDACVRAAERRREGSPSAPHPSSSSPVATRNRQAPFPPAP